MIYLFHVLFIYYLFHLLFIYLLSAFIYLLIKRKNKPHLRLFEHYILHILYIIFAYFEINKQPFLQKNLVVVSEKLKKYYLKNPVKYTFLALTNLRQHYYSDLPVRQ